MKEKQLRWTLVDCGLQYYGIHLAVGIYLALRIHLDRDLSSSVESILIRGVRHLWGSSSWASVRKSSTQIVPFKSGWLVNLGLGIWCRRFLSSTFQEQRSYFFGARLAQSQIHFLVGGANRGFHRMGARKALQRKAGMALSAPRGQTLSGAVCPRPIYSYGIALVWGYRYRLRLILQIASVHVLN